MDVSTLAGSSEGFADGIGSAAQFNSPNGIDVDHNGNVYVADAANHCIRKITAGGLVSTLAGGTEGNADGEGAGAKFKTPYGVAVDVEGYVFVADTGNHLIRKVSPGGTVTTVAGSGLPGFKDAEDQEAMFKSPFSLDLDENGNLYVADAGNHRIRKVTRDGTVSTVAGGQPGYVDGPIGEARFFVPNDVAIGAADVLYVADYSNHCIRKIVLATGMVSTFAGNGVKGTNEGKGSAAQFNSPTGLTVDRRGKVIVADNLNHRLRRIESDGHVLTHTGAEAGYTDGSYTAARFRGPTDVAADANGNLYVADTDNHRIRKIR